jgi:predicted DCC family thiol-disulfide oxidoreductase YuxK
MMVKVVRFTVADVDAAAGSERPYTCVYDGNCKVCTRLTKVLNRWDRDDQIQIVPSQASGVMARFPWIPSHAYTEALQLIGPGGETWSGAAAIEKLLDILPKGKLLAWVFHIPFVRGLADRFYKWFARNRYRLGCGEHCQLRPPDVDFRES